MSLFNALVIVPEFLWVPTTIQPYITGTCSADQVSYAFDGECNALLPASIDGAAECEWGHVRRTGDKYQNRLTSQTQRVPDDNARAADAFPNEDWKTDMTVSTQDRTATRIWATRENVTPRRVRRTFILSFSHQSSLADKTIRLARLPSSWDRRSGSCWLSWRKTRAFLLVRWSSRSEPSNS